MCTFVPKHPHVSFNVLHFYTLAYLHIVHLALVNTFGTLAAGVQQCGRCGLGLLGRILIPIPGWVQYHSLQIHRMSRCHSQPATTHYSLLAHPEMLLFFSETPALDWCCVTTVTGAGQFAWNCASLVVYRLGNVSGAHNI